MLTEKQAKKLVNELGSAFDAKFAEFIARSEYKAAFAALAKTGDEKLVELLREGLQQGYRAGWFAGGAQVFTLFGLTAKALSETATDLGETLQ